MPNFGQGKAHWFLYDVNGKIVTRGKEDSQKERKEAPIHKLELRRSPMFFLLPQLEPHNGVFIEDYI